MSYIEHEPEEILRPRLLEADYAAWALIALGAMKILVTLWLPNDSIDPLFGVRSSILAVASGAFECAVGMGVRAIPAVNQKNLIIASCAVLFLGVRFLYTKEGLSVANCPCLGNVEGLIPAVAAYKENILWAISLFLLLCPAASLFANRSISYR